MDRRKKLLNGREARTLETLRVVADRNGCRAFPKVRIADVLAIDGSGISADFFRYALAAHFDFVVADAEDMPLFAVEFDGPVHDRDARTIANDAKKNEICRRLGLPLARVRDQHLFEKARGIDYLTWLVELFFAQMDICRAQQDGSAPADEYLDPFMFVSHPAIDGRFPFWISMNERVRLRGLYKAGAIAAPLPMVFTGESPFGESALLLLPLPDDRFLTARSSIYVDGFGVAPSEAADEIGIITLAHSLHRYLQGEAEAVSRGDARRNLVEFFRAHRCLSSSIKALHLGFAVSYRSGPPSEWHIGGLDGEPEVVIPAS